MTEKRSLTIDRVLNAPPERVFAAWTDTAQLAQWYGPEGMSCEVFENDVTPGGRYALVMRSPEGEYRASARGRRDAPAAHPLGVQRRGASSLSQSRLVELAERPRALPRGRLSVFARCGL